MRNTAPQPNIAPTNHLNYKSGAPIRAFDSGMYMGGRGSHVQTDFHAASRKQTQTRSQKVKRQPGLQAQPPGRPGTAPKRPHSPSTIGLTSNKPSGSASFNATGSGEKSGQANHLSHTVLSYSHPFGPPPGQKRASSHKPSSAQQKQRNMRSQSPMNQFPEGTKSGSMGSSSGKSKQQQMVGAGGLFPKGGGLAGLGDSGPQTSYIPSHGSAGISGGPAKINSYVGGTQGVANGQQVQYRGYSPSKPKWKANNLGVPQTNNLMGGSMVSNGAISHVQGYSATSGLRTKTKHH